MSFISSVLSIVLLSVVILLANAQTSYNSATQTCCNGTVTDNKESEFLSCCGSKAFDPKRSLCCSDDHVIEIPEKSLAFGSHSCCPDKAANSWSYFDQLTQVCCNGKVLDKPDPRAPYGCCNGELYNAISHLCCGGKLYRQNQVDACCGDKELYNSETQICCSRFGFDENHESRPLEFLVSRRTSNVSGCCGLKEFDSRLNVCCGDVVKPKTEDIALERWGSCCNGVPYDSSKKLCCNKWGQITPNQSGIVESALYDFDEKDTVTSCCGIKHYNFRKEVCCGDEKIVPKPEGVPENVWLSCCGDKPITNFTTQLCFNNKLYEREDFNFFVCGDQLFDTRKQQCCGDKLYDKDSTLKCCFGSHLYDNTVSKCCLDKVVPLTEEDIAAKHDACCVVEKRPERSYYNISFVI